MWMQRTFNPRSAPSGLDHLVDGKASERLTAL
jgi:hypothetical protein